jgi:hypothetical protein
MKNGISLKSAATRIITGLLLILGFGFPSGYGQSLNTDGVLHTISGTSQYLDYIIPTETDKPYLNISITGADGGARAFRPLGIECRHSGGQGAHVAGWYKIGSDGLTPGGTLRFIVGQPGTDANGGGTEGAGGGGGTGVVYLPKGANGYNLQNWQILMVAGGGGGAASDGFCGGHAGKPGESGTSGSNGDGSSSGNGGSDGDGGGKGYNGSGGGGWVSPGKGTGDIRFSHRDIRNNMTSIRSGGSSGSGYILDGGGSYTYNPGWWVGGLGGQHYSTPGLDKAGGTGFGGGGGGRGSGGGGGGFSGGGGGGATGAGNGGGGGGGSYVNRNLTLLFSGVTLEQRGTTDRPEIGKVEYQFFAPSPVAVRNLGFEYHIGQEAPLLKAGEWTLLWQYDGNLVLYSSGGPAWASNTAGTDMYFQGDGNLVIYQANGGPTWSTDTPNDHHNGKGGRKLVLTQEGHLFIADQDGKTIWQGH